MAAITERGRLGRPRSAESSRPNTSDLLARRRLASPHADDPVLCASGPSGERLCLGVKARTASRRCGYVLLPSPVRSRCCGLVITSPRLPGRSWIGWKTASGWRRRVVNRARRWPGGSRTSAGRQARLPGVVCPLRGRTSLERSRPLGIRMRHGQPAFNGLWSITPTGGRQFLDLSVWWTGPAGALPHPRER